MGTLAQPGLGHQPLFAGEMAGQDWAHLGTGVGVWVLLPLAIGTWRVLTREVK